ncbi:MarR family transcriptional regulator [Oligoflexus tunisiensis]|uniref:MarR family transcriptional regulator n=1 Tax=Oligoflexus tunisiensis TaxID=708132 RepID=UPI00114CE5CF|nr:MarR family transcriptional regulator [Oligoflexus tunisiensis]
MSTDRRQRRAELIEATLASNREVGALSIFFHGAVASQLGLTPAETKCIDIILRSTNPDRVTAGWLAEHSGLTTGAITTLVDRLEQVGLVRRQRSSEDRRKVYVQLLPKCFERLAPLYESLGKAMQQLLDEYSEEQLLLIVNYQKRCAEILALETAKLKK